MKQNILTGLILGTFLMAGALFVPAQADYHHHYHDYYFDRGYGGNFFYNHPVVSEGLLGTGLGAVAGGLLSPEGDRTGGAVRGAVIGGAAGVGLGLLTQPRYRW